MNTNEILAKAEEIKKTIEYMEKMLNIKKVLSIGSEKVIKVKYKACLREDEIEVNTTDEICQEIIKAFETQIIKERNKLHEINGEPLEEIQEQKTNFEKIDTILKEINNDEYENREDKEELLRDYLEDYKKIREELSQDGFQPLNRNCFIESIKDLIALKNNGIDFEEKNSKLENENKQLAKALFDDMNDKNIFRNQIYEHLKEMDIICKAH